MTSQTNQKESSPAKRQAVVLLSGGLDSYTAAAIAGQQGFSLYAMTVDYGQRHRRELQSAQRIVDSLGVCQHKIIELDLRRLGGSALTSEIAVPKSTDFDTKRQSGIPITYVPARNTILLALALAWAEVLEIFDIFIGVNAVDYSGYPDCRGEFITAFEKLANLATKAAVEKKGKFRIHTPLLYLSKAQIIREGVKMGLDYSLTHSCYDPDEEGRACGRCDSCRLRRQGFAQANRKDPLEYAP